MVCGVSSRISIIQAYFMRVDCSIVSRLFNEGHHIISFEQQSNQEKRGASTQWSRIFINAIIIGIRFVVEIFQIRTFFLIETIWRMFPVRLRGDNNDKGHKSHFVVFYP